MSVDQSTTAGLVDRLMTVWSQLPADPHEARDAFCHLYAEQVRLNGQVVPLDDLLVRARGLQEAFSDIGHRVVECLADGDKLVVAFMLTGVHTGTYVTPVGDLPATGERFKVLAMDVLTVADGRIVEITAISDQLGLLRALGSVSVATAS